VITRKHRNDGRFQSGQPCIAAAAAVRRLPAQTAAAAARAIDVLERRLLLSAMHDPETGLLTVNGTNAGETIEVELYFDPGGSPSANQIRTRVGGVAQTFTGSPLTLPERIFVNAGGGNDTVRVFYTGGLGFLYRPKVEAFGGDGNDVINLDFGVGTSVNGGAGNDTVQGGNWAVLHTTSATPSPSRS
jgi:hypothetical protein